MEVGGEHEAAAIVLHAPSRRFRDTAAPARRAARSAPPRSPARIPAPARSCAARSGCRARWRSTRDPRSLRAAGGAAPARGSPRAAVPTAAPNSQRSRGAAAAAHGKRDDQPGGERAEEDQQQELAEVRRHPSRASSRTASTSGSWPSATRWAASRSTVRTSIESRAGKRMAEKRAPQSTSGHVDVERARVEGLNGQLDPAHAQVALGAVGSEREQPPGQCGDHDKGHRGAAADGPHRPETSAGAEGGYS